MEKCHDPSDENDLTALNRRREGLCPFADLVAKAIEVIEPPDHIGKPAANSSFPWWLVHRGKRSESG